MRDLQGDCGYVLVGRFRCQVGIVLPNQRMKNIDTANRLNCSISFNGSNTGPHRASERSTTPETPLLNSNHILYSIPVVRSNYF